mgnify:FL=1
MARFFLAFLLSFTLMFVQAQDRFDSAIEQLLQKPEYKEASVGILIEETKSGQPVYTLNPDKLLIPASTMKLITTATAFRVLGADYRFETKIAYSGKINKDRILEGDLVLVGGADPALGSEYFQDHYYRFLQNWAQKIKDAGIDMVEGDLVLDASVYDSEKVPATWIWEDIGNYYGAGANAFTVYDNMFRITFRSPKRVGELTDVIAMWPVPEGLQLKNEVLSSAENRDNAYVFGSPLDKVRVIRGTIPSNRRAFTIKAAIHDPATILAADFQKALANIGIFVKGNVVFKNSDHSKYQVVYVQESPTLAEIAKVLIYESVNLFAEHFLKQLAVEENGLGKRADAIDIIHNYWKRNGLSNEFFMEDGSGLSHFNAVSPRFFAELLRSMHDNPDFVSTLPTAGEGTLDSFEADLFPGTTLQAKSGSMTRVRCYSGYLKTDSGKELVFSIMFNHFSGQHSALIKEIETLLSTMKSTI